MPQGPNNIDKRMQRIIKDIEKLPPKIHKFFVKVTPKDTGFAKRNTRLKGNKICKDYHYEKYLEKGHSDQAPNGMTIPTIEYCTGLVKAIFRKK